MKLGLSWKKSADSINGILTKIHSLVERGRWAVLDCPYYSFWPIKYKDGKQ